MNLFKHKPAPQTEVGESIPIRELSPLESAAAELEAASQACAESSRHCAELDELQKSWMTQREAAFHEHSKNLDRHAAAKDRWLRLSKPAPVAPFPVGAVLEKT